MGGVSGPGVDGGKRDAESGNPDKSLWQCFSKCGPRATRIRPTYLAELVPRQIQGSALNEAGALGQSLGVCLWHPQVNLGCVKV